MKKLFSLAVFALAATALFTACDKGDNGSTDTAPVITVASKAVSVVGTAAQHSIAYTMDGTKEGEAVSASTSAEWITIDNCTPTAVEFSVATNSDSKARSAFIVLSYKKATPVSVLVSQSAQENVDADMRFAITVSDIGTTLATVTVVPTTQSPYYFGIVTKKEYAKAGKDEAINGFIDYIKSDLEYYPDRSINDYIVTGKQSFEFSPLWSQTDYCVVAFDLNKEYGYSGNVTVEEFTTEPTGISGNDFRFAIDGTKVTVTPLSTAQGKYYITGVMDIYKWSYYPSSDYYSGAFYAAFDYLDSLGSAMQDNLLTGEHTIDYAATLNASAYDTFIAFAFGTNGNGIVGYNPDIQGDVAFVKFEYEHDTATVSQTSAPLKAASRAGNHYMGCAAHNNK